ncbi:MAG: PD-(D/E)XK nuclease family protein, partial [Clostridia bacterium]|nr:PD-(D/E)XK nuclease family protein [Clostridia bacterium]
FIRGKIDRIDSYGDYIAVIDYKSKRSVSYGLKEIYYGERVQLLIYLNAYCSKTKCEPFALLYMPLPYAYSNEDSSGVFSYSGLVRNLQGVFEHFDNKYNDKNISCMPISISKSGDVSDKGLLSQEGLRILREYADKVVANAIEEIESGYIEAKPTNCDNCEFGRICLNKNNPQNKRTKLTASSFKIKGGDTNGKDKI